jgi:hypothetical protein
MVSSINAIFNLVMFLVGIIVFVYFSFAFFYFIVRIAPQIVVKLRNKMDKVFPNRINILQKIRIKDAEQKMEESPIDDQHKAKVDFYISRMFKITRTGRFSHFSRHKFTKVFQYQHFNAVLYVIFILSLILIRGMMKDAAIYIIPAGASFFILFTVSLLLISLFYITFRSWTVLIVSLIFLLYSYTLPFKNVLDYHNSAYGLVYHGNKKTPININAHGDFQKDSLFSISILEKWKAKNISTKNPNKKPKLVVICTSGGGLKMAVWTNSVLSYADSIMHGKLLQHTELITGASGGMLGAAYLRENYLRYLNGKGNYNNHEKTEALAKDLLNPIFFSYSMSDWFFRLQSFQYNGQRYFKDRGYELEQSLVRNIGPIFDKPIKAYSKSEASGQIPLLFISPSIENVGSRMLISSTPVSYMMKSTLNSKIKNFEFSYTYKDFGAENLRFSSAIRMNATFPYVSPDVALPGKPTLYLIDAGLNDNYGVKTAYDFISEFKIWIKENTSGVLLIQLDENRTIDYKYLNNPIQSILRPIGSVFVDWSNIQQIDQAALIQNLKQDMGFQFDIIHLEFNGNTRQIALSWHLSKLEKNILHQSLYSQQTQENIKTIKKLLE